MFEDQKPIPRLALRIGIAGAIGFGALATGMFATRKGRHLVKEAWAGRERTRLEDRVLDAIWDDPRLARRQIDVTELKAGHVRIDGVVRSIGEGRRAIRLAAEVSGIEQIDNALRVVPRPPQKRPAEKAAAALERVRSAGTPLRRPRDEDDSPLRRPRDEDDSPLRRPRDEDDPPRRGGGGRGLDD
jgi:hypothetical protein